MTVRELIEELKKYDGDLPICIDDYMGFVEAHEKSIKAAKKQYMTFPFTDNDKFYYVNLSGQRFDY